MSYLNFQNLQLDSFCPFSIKDLIALFSNSNSHYLFIKDNQFRYAWANQNFIQLMGLKEQKQIIGLSDYHLYTDKKQIRQYQEYDAFVLEQETSLKLEDKVEPRLNPYVVKTMEGMEYPFAVNSDKANFVLGIVSSKIQCTNLDWNTIFKLKSQELKELLSKRSYNIRLPFGEVSLTKRELQVLVTLLKGYHAGEIAKFLFLQQTTVESYLATIKNKLAVSSKAELINLVIANHLLEQIFV